MPAGGNRGGLFPDWLGHADPAFTLRTYVHLMDGGLGDADFLDVAVAAQSGNGWQHDTRNAPQTVERAPRLPRAPNPLGERRRAEWP